MQTFLADNVTRRRHEKACEQSVPRVAEVVPVQGATRLGPGLLAQRLRSLGEMKVLVSFHAPK